MHTRIVAALGLSLGAFGWASAVHAQAQPSGDHQPTGAVPPPEGPSAAAAPDASGRGSSAEVPTNAPPPPEYVFTPAPAPKHAPRFALWAGARLGLIAYGGSFYEYQLPNERPQLETTGNLVLPGVDVEANIGARLGKRYVPYVFAEHAFMRAGRLFEGTDTQLTSNYFGVGFRTIFGNVDDIGFVADLALGLRVLRASNDTQSWSMQTLELFRFGLGAEFWVSNTFVLSPMFTASTGSMSDTEGAIAYKSGATIPGPLFQNGESISSSRVYIVAGVGCGAHFDLFGK